MKTNKNIPLLVHTKMAAFAWGKIVIDYAHIVAKKAGMNVIVMHSWQEVVQWGESNVIPVMGVD